MNTYWGVPTLFKDTEKALQNVKSNYWVKGTVNRLGLKRTKGISKDPLLWFTSYTSIDTHLQTEDGGLL